MNRILIFICALMIAWLPAKSQQNITIEQCYEWAKQNYPLIKQQRLIELSKDYSISNANKMYFPQLALSAQATYQSDVPTIEVPFPGIKIPSVSKDQYQAVLELNQTIWDGGNTESQKSIIKAGSAVETQKNEVDLYTIRDRVNQVYFGVLLLNEQWEQNKLLQNELQKNCDKIKSYIANGIANESDWEQMQAELLSTKQREIEILSIKKTYLQMLAYLTNKNLGEGTVLGKPASSKSVSTNINRLELGLFDAQKNLFQSQSKSITANEMPKLGVFVQGGYGKPGLNMLQDEFDFFYIGGVRLKWNISSLYTNKNSRRKIGIDQQTVDVQKETFLFNTNLQVTQAQNEIDRIDQLIATDNEIITLRSNVKKAAESKVTNGTYTITDLIREINAENLSRQNKILHEVQQLKAIYDLKYITNN